MSADWRFSRWASVRAKIALLPLMGVAGILLIAAVQYVAQDRLQTALLLERDAAAVKSEVSDLLRMESNYLVRIQPDLLKEINALSEQVNQTIERAAAHAGSKAVITHLKSAEQSINNHLDAFRQAAESARNLQEAHTRLNEMFRKNDDLSSDAMVLVSREETEKMMLGESLPESKKTVRDKLKEYLAQSSFCMALVNDLLAFSDLERYEASIKGV